MEQAVGVDAQPGGGWSGLSVTCRLPPEGGWRPHRKRGGRRYGSSGSRRLHRVSFKEMARITEYGSGLLSYRMRDSVRACCGSMTTPDSGVLAEMGHATAT